MEAEPTSLEPAWKGEFQAVLERRGITHRIKEPTDASAMGKLDATQQRRRAILLVKVDGGGGKEPWSQRLPGVVRTYNENWGTRVSRPCAR